MKADRYLGQERTGALYIRQRMGRIDKQMEMTSRRTKQMRSCRDASATTRSPDGEYVKANKSHNNTGSVVIVDTTDETREVWARNLLR